MVGTVISGLATYLTPSLRFSSPLSSSVPQFRCSWLPRFSSALGISGDDEDKAHHFCRYCGVCSLRCSAGVHYWLTTSSATSMKMKTTKTTKRLESRVMRTNKPLGLRQQKMRARLTRNTQMDNPNDPAIAHLFPALIAIYKPVSHASQTRRAFLAEGYRAPLVRSLDECQGTHSECGSPHTTGIADRPGVISQKHSTNPLLPPSLPLSHVQPSLSYCLRASLSLLPLYSPLSYKALWGWFLALQGN